MTKIIDTHTVFSKFQRTENKPTTKCSTIVRHQLKRFIAYFIRFDKIISYTYVGVWHVLAYRPKP